MKKTAQVLMVVTSFLLGSSLVMAQGTTSVPPLADQERAALAPSADMLEMGRNVAGTACAECHGMDGMRTGDGQPYLSGQRAVYLFRVLQDYQERGRENEAMRHIGRVLNEDAMLAVSAYYAGLTRTGSPAPADEPAAGDPLGDNPFTGISDALGKCVRCHGETGNSATSGMPSLTAQHPEYFVKSMNAYVDGSRSHRLMGRLVGALDESTIAQMGLYYAVQEPLPTEIRGDGDAEAGRSAAEACANCHGSDGNAAGSDMPTLAGQDARYFVKAMGAYRDGKRKHEAMFNAVEALSEDEIDDMAAFYAAQTPLRRDVRTPYSTAEWVERCERCHGLEGNSTDPRFPMLAGQNAEYLRRAMLAYSTGGRSRSIMHAMSEPLTENDVEQIVNYYASREPRSVIYLQLPCGEGDAE